MDQAHLEETGESGDRRIRLIYGGVELSDREWLRPQSARISLLTCVTGFECLDSLHAASETSNALRKPIS